MLRQCCDETSICTRPLPEHSYLSEASEEVAPGFPPLVFYLENEGLHRHLARASHRARHSGLDVRINHGSGVMLAGPVAKGLDTVTPPF